MTMYYFLNKIENSHIRIFIDQIKRSPLEYFDISLSKTELKV